METIFRSTVLRFRNTDVQKTKQNNDFTKTNFLFTKQNNDFRNFCIENPLFFLIFMFFSSKTLRFFWFSNVFERQFHVFPTKAIFERQFYILDQKTRNHCVFTCFCHFFAAKTAPRRFLSDSSIFWTKKPENTVFSHVFTIFYDTKAYKSEKKNAANDAPGKQNTISRHFMRNQKTSQVR